MSSSRNIGLPLSILLPFVICTLVIACSQAASSIPANPSDLTASHILASHANINDAPERHFPDLAVLGFATPWNARGADVARSESSRSRLDLLSPVTYQVTSAGLQGGHDYDADFYNTVNTSGSYILPRVLFEPSSLRSSTVSLPDIINTIIQTCSTEGFAGVVIEIWQSFAALNSGAMTAQGYEVMRQIGTKLRDAGLRTALVLPPFGNDYPQAGVRSTDINALSIGYSYFIVMTYDFSTPASQPGPLAPMEWVSTIAKYMSTTCQLGSKVLLGLNFYGVDFSSDPGSKGENKHVVGHEVIQLLEKYNPQFMWHDKFQEHVFGYRDDNDNRQRIVFYPTRHSIAARVRVAKSTGCGGVAIWDLGQGLDYFFEEF